MARRPGTRPKPAAQRLREGNPGRRPIDENQPEGDGNRPPKPPHITGKAAKTWKWLCDVLDDLGLLASTDVAIIALYCDTWTEYVEARKNVNKYGPILFSKKDNMPFSSPYLNQEAMFKKQLERYLTELGLSPSSRSRVSAVPKAAPAGKERLLRIVG